MFKEFTALEKQNLKECFSESHENPFSHLVIPQFLDPKTASECSKEFKNLILNHSDDFVRYHDENFEFEKYALNDISKVPPALKKLFFHLKSPEFIKTLEDLTGLNDLRVDPVLWGGGLHMTKKGGYLACHKDFSVLPTSFNQEKQLLRVINIIGYLTPEWKAGWGAELELWDNSGKSCVKKIEPQYNTWIIFDTRGSYHGHPYPYLGDAPRLSIAAYYYQEKKIDRSEWASTEYLKLPWKEDSEEYQLKRKERANAEVRYKKLIKD